jgi:hypothetical protein
LPDHTRLSFMVLAMNIGSFSVMTSSVHLAAGNTYSLKCVEVLYRCIELSNGVFMRRVTDGARTRDLLSSATIRTHWFTSVRQCWEICITNCGRPVHQTAHVPTPEADIPVSPPPQQVGRAARQPPQQEAGAQPQRRSQVSLFSRRRRVLLVLLLYLSLSCQH